MPEQNWTSRLAFIITTSAFSIGLGNIWRFPYIAGEGGGGAFLIVYLILIFLLGIPILTIEIGLGRMSGTTTLLGYGKLGKHASWNIVGWVEFVTVLLIMSFYIMILAWVLIYFGDSVLGRNQGLSSEELSTRFDQITGQLTVVLPVIMGILLLAGFIVSRGLQSGIERYSKWMMIGLFVLIIGLAIWAGTLEGAAEGYRWFLSPDFSKLSFSVVLSAIGQLFFSLGVGMAAAFAFGSYTQAKDNLISSTSWIVFADSFIAILAGFLIFPALFSFNLSPDSGPSLVFVTMASVFSQINWGGGWGALFFLLLFFAGFTSLISCMQGMKDSLRDKFQWSGSKSLLVVSLAIGLGSIPSVLSHSSTPLVLWGSTFYVWIDFLTGVILLPLAGLLIVLYSVYVLSFDQVRNHLLQGAEGFKIHSFWKYVLKFVIPALLIVLFLSGLF